MKTQGSRETGQVITFLSIIMILFGLLLIVTGQAVFVEGLWSKLFDSLGILVTSIFVVSLLYEKFVAEKHFGEFMQVLNRQLRSMDTLQSRCLRLGIEELFESRTEYELKYPLAYLIDIAKPNTDFLTVGRSLFHLLHKESELKDGLRKGLHFRIACLDPEYVTPQMSGLTQVYSADIQSTLAALSDLVAWAQEERAPGVLELRYHRLYLPDSGLMLEGADGPLLVWDLSFGRDLSMRRVILLKPAPTNLGANLANRYQAIWKQSECKFLLEKGAVEHDDLGVLKEAAGVDAPEG